MRVWRLETLDPSGTWKGPYVLDSRRSAEETQLQHQMHLDHADRPAPAGLYDDRLDLDEWLCGCSSRRKLGRWFGSYLDRWMELGARIAVYEAPRVRGRGPLRSQLVFHHPSAHLIHTLCAGELQTTLHPSLSRDLSGAL